MVREREDACDGRIRVERRERLSEPRLLLRPHFRAELRLVRIQEHEPERTVRVGSPAPAPEGGKPLEEIPKGGALAQPVLVVPEDRMDRDAGLAERREERVDPRPVARGRAVEDEVSERDDEVRARARRSPRRESGSPRGSTRARTRGATCAEGRRGRRSGRTGPRSRVPDETPEERGIVRDDPVDSERGERAQPVLLVHGPDHERLDAAPAAVPGRPVRPRTGNRPTSAGPFPWPRAGTRTAGRRGGRRAARSRP